MLKKHHTPQYFFNRLKQRLFEYQEPDAPWLTKESVYLLDQLINKTDKGLEFGSGRSTKWLAKRCSHLISIEHHQGWYEKVKKDIALLANVDFFHKSIEADTPLLSDYYQAIDHYGTQFHFCLIDGKYREILCVAAIDKLLPGGLLILDNAERYITNTFDIPESIGVNSSKLSAPAKDFLDRTANWRRIWTSNGVSATLIMFKP